jgi:hypothetical protein
MYGAAERNHLTKSAETESAMEICRYLYKSMHLMRESAARKALATG